ncbi:unnamed protein product [Cyclocybe aegerita]|uniref:Uncharacterized protein n=1 Tax=Cyclocybe aegerita TaxID=1973307 RepID=A0A8S0VWS7_CYCAE|nr:unnamed protein product [Cyclocybe aegerita]
MPSNEKTSQNTNSALEKAKSLFFLIPILPPNAFKKLEKKMDLEDKFLRKNFKMLSYELELGNSQPCTVSTLIRIYSPTKPAYADVHFESSSCDWRYQLGFKLKIHAR